MNNNNELSNFYEAGNVEEANRVNMDYYRFETYSETRGVYIFVKRVRK